MNDALPGPVEVLGSDASGAVFSPCARYRYLLWRRWAEGPHALFVCLNPSTADHERLDPTLRRCRGFAQAWGLGGMRVLNLFAFRATRPEDLKAAEAPVGPLNDAYFRHEAARAGLIVAGWGVHGTHHGRHLEAPALLGPMQCLGLTKEGHPRHPLYLRRDARLQPFRPPR